MHEIDTDSPADTICRTSVVLMLAHRQRRSDIKTTLVQKQHCSRGDEYHHHV